MDTGAATEDGVEEEVVVVGGVVEEVDAEAEAPPPPLRIGTPPAACWEAH